MVKKIKTYDLSDIIEEGKHKGKKVKNVCMEDPRWVDRVESNGTVKFTNSVLYYLEEILKDY
jgi:hypothetical protein